MEAVGRLAGGVAHDLNNTLMITSSYAELLLTRSGLDDTAKKYARQIVAASHSGSSVIRQLLGFSRKQLIEPRVLDLNSVIMRLGAMLPRLIGEDVKIDVAQAPDLGHVKADPGQIEQVLMNL